MTNTMNDSMVIMQNNEDHVLKMLTNHQTYTFYMKKCLQISHRGVKGHGKKQISCVKEEIKEKTWFRELT